MWSASLLPEYNESLGTDKTAEGVKILSKDIQSLLEATISECPAPLPRQPEYCSQANRERVCGFIESEREDLGLSDDDTTRAFLLRCLSVTLATDEGLPNARAGEAALLKALVSDVSVKPSAFAAVKFVVDERETSSSHLSNSKIVNTADPQGKDCLPVFVGAPLASRESNWTRDSIMVGFQQMPPFVPYDDCTDAVRNVTGFARAIAQRESNISRLLRPGSWTRDTTDVFQNKVQEIVSRSLYSCPDARMESMAKELGLCASQARAGTPTSATGCWNPETLLAINKDTVPRGYEMGKEHPLEQTFEFNRVVLEIVEVKPLGVHQENCTLNLRDRSALRVDLERLLSVLGSTNRVTRQEFALRLNAVLKRHGVAVNESSVLTSAARDDLMDLMVQEGGDACSLSKRAGAVDKALAWFDRMATRLFMESAAGKYLPAFANAHMEVTLRARFVDPVDKERGCVLVTLAHLGGDTKEHDQVDAAVLHDGDLVRATTADFQVSSLSCYANETGTGLCVMPACPTTADADGKGTICNGSIVCNADGTFRAESVWVADRLTTIHYRVSSFTFNFLRLLFNVEERDGLAPPEQLKKEREFLDGLTPNTLIDACRDIATDPDNFVPDGHLLVALLLHRHNKDSEAFAKVSAAAEDSVSRERNRRRFVAVNCQQRVEDAAVGCWSLAYMYNNTPRVRWREHNAGASVTTHPLRPDEETLMHNFLKENPSLREVYLEHEANLQRIGGGDDGPLPPSSVPLSSQEQLWKPLLLYAAAYKRPPTTPQLRGPLLGLLAKEPRRVLQFYEATQQMSQLRAEHNQSRKKEMREVSQEQMRETGYKHHKDTPWRSKRDRVTDYADAAKDPDDVIDSVQGLKAILNPTHIEWEVEEQKRLLRQRLMDEGGDQYCRQDAMHPLQQQMHLYFSRGKVDLPAVAMQGRRRPSPLHRDGGGRGKGGGGRGGGRAVAAAAAAGGGAVTRHRFCGHESPRKRKFHAP